MDTTRRNLIFGMLATSSALAVTTPGVKQALSQITDIVNPAIAQGNTTKKSVLITGCSSGIGRATALVFARSGYRTIASMRNLQTKNVRAASELRSIAKNENLDLHLVEIDITSDQSVREGIQAAAKINENRFDVVINNAGIMLPLPVELLPATAWQMTFDTNVMGASRIGREVLPYMRGEQDGLIVQITSGAGRVVFPLLGSYCANKFALEAMSDAMRYELAPFGVDVVVVQPDDTKTRLFANARNYLQQTLKAMSSNDQKRLQDYQQHMGLIDKAIEEEEDAMEPTTVAEEILKIAEMPKGQRPQRKRLGSQRVKAINDLMAQTQQQILKNSPFAPWLTVKLKLPKRS